MVTLQDFKPVALARIGEVVGFGGGKVRINWADGTASWTAPAELFVASADDAGPPHEVLTPRQNQQN